MKYLKRFLVFLVFAFTFAGLIQSVDARGADEPCSYLNPTKYVRDSGGNCVIASSGSISGVTSTGVPQTGVSQARSTSEPCSYLSPTKYIRDSSGSCILAQQSTASQIAPANTYSTATSIPATSTATSIPATSTVTATSIVPANSSENIFNVAIIFLLGILSFIAYKVFGDRFRQPQIKYRPRQHTGQKSENYVDNRSAAERTTARNSTVQEATGTWNGGYYDDDTLEDSK